MPEQITFEQGFEELTQILDSLEQGEVAVAETVEKCRRAKALEHALRGFLDGQGGTMFMATKRSTRVAWSRQSRNPIHPPQSWPARRTRSRSSASSSAKTSRAIVSRS